MTPTPEFHVGNKSFIAQQFSFSIFWGNPRRKRTEQIKSDAADARKKRTGLFDLFSRAKATILQQFDGDPRQIANNRRPRSTDTDAERGPANFESLSRAAL